MNVLNRLTLKSIVAKRPATPNDDLNLEIENDLMNDVAIDSILDVHMNEDLILGISEPVLNVNVSEGLKIEDEPNNEDPSMDVETYLTMELAKDSDVAVKSILDTNVDSKSKLDISNTSKIKKSTKKRKKSNMDINTSLKDVIQPHTKVYDELRINEDVTKSNKYVKPSIKKSDMLLQSIINSGLNKRNAMLDIQIDEVFQPELNIFSTPKKVKKTPMEINSNIDTLDSEITTDSSTAIDTDILQQDLQFYNEMERVNVTTQSNKLSTNKYSELLLRSIINAGTAEANVDLNQKNTNEKLIIDTNRDENFQTELDMFDTPKKKKKLNKNIDSYLNRDSFYIETGSETVINRDLPQQSILDATMTNNNIAKMMEVKDSLCHIESATTILGINIDKNSQSGLDVSDVPKKCEDISEEMEKTNLEVDTCLTSESVVNLDVESVINEDSSEQYEELTNVISVGGNTQPKINIFRMPKKNKKQSKRKKQREVVANNYSAMELIMNSDAEIQRETVINKDLHLEFTRKNSALGANVEENSKFELDILSTPKKKKPVENKSNKNKYNPSTPNVSLDRTQDFNDIRSNETNMNNIPEVIDLDCDYSLDLDVFYIQTKISNINFPEQNIEKIESQINTFHPHKTQKKDLDFDKWLYKKYHMGVQEYITSKMISLKSQERSFDVLTKN